MIRRPAAFLVAAFIAIGSIVGLTGGCRAAETQAAAQTEAATPTDDRTQAKARTVEERYMGLSSGPLSQATIADLPDGVVVQSGDLPSA